MTQQMRMQNPKHRQVQKVHVHVLFLGRHCLALCARYTSMPVSVLRLATNTGLEVLMLFNGHCSALSARYVSMLVAFVRAACVWTSTVTFCPSVWGIVDCMLRKGRVTN